jgi:hypothetical protein
LFCCLNISVLLSRFSVLGVAPGNNQTNSPRLEEAP